MVYIALDFIPRFVQFSDDSAYIGDEQQSKSERSDDLAHTRAMSSVELQRSQRSVISSGRASIETANLNSDHSNRQDETGWPSSSEDTSK